MDTWGGTRVADVVARLSRGDRPLAVVKAQADSGSRIAKLSMSLAGVAPGECTVQVTAAGRAGTARFTIPQDPPWLGTKVGVTDAVPTPWTDMRVSGKSVHCWNRRYDLAPGPLPQQIVSADEPILADPVTLRVRTGETDLAWGSPNVEVTGTKAACVSFTSTASDDGARLAVEGRVEFDGMCWFETTLTPTGRELAVERIALDIPLRAEHVRFWRGMVRPVVEKAAGEVREEDGVAFSHRFLPVLWLGSDDRGLQWFTETSEPWDDPTRGDSIQIVRKRDITHLRVTPVASKRTLKTPWRFAFGLQASPIRQFFL